MSTPQKNAQAFLFYFVGPYFQPLGNNFVGMGEV